MDLTEQERRFLARRTRFLNSWRYVGSALLLVLAAFAGALFWFVPLLANPFAVLARLNGNSIPESSMALSTALLPVVVLICLFLAAAVVLLGFAAFSNERKYLAIIERVTGPRAPHRSAAEPDL